MTFPPLQPVKLQTVAGVDPGFSEGGANGNASVERVPLKLFMFVAKFIFLWHLHLFVAARFLLACVFRELVILML